MAVTVISPRRASNASCATLSPACRIRGRAKSSARSSRAGWRSDLPAVLQQLIVDSAARHPERTAVVDRDASMTYRELDEASLRLAEELRARGVGPGTRVGLYLDKSL